MKKAIVVVMGAMAGIVLLGLTACSKNEEGMDTSKVQPVNTAQAPALDTSKLQSAFQTAPEVDKAEVQNAIAAVKSKDYAGAMASLQKVAGNANLTPEQKSAAQDFLGQLQAKSTELGKKMLGAAAGATNQAAPNATKVSEDLQKAQPK